MNIKLKKCNKKFSIWLHFRFRRSDVDIRNQ